MICIKCGINFPNWITIDNKRRNLQHRKFCLSCSPFNRHNTRNIANHKPSYKSPRTCSACQKLYKQKGLLCPACDSLRKRTLSNERAVLYKGGKCILCNYSKCIANLAFHHLDPTKKDFIISDGHSRTFDKIKTELDKCILLCQNCHGELHWNETNTRRQIIKTMLCPESDSNRRSKD